MEKWLEIDLQKLKQNVRALQKYFQVPVMAVVKQNAYGLGALTIAGFLEQLGIRFFAVTNISEGIELRKGGIVSPILIFAPCFNDREELGSLWHYNLVPAVYSLEAAGILNQYALEMAKPIDVHLKVDTGMGRMGFTPAELLSAAERLKQLGGLRYQAIFTHYSNAFEKEMDYTKKQRDRFLNLVNELAAMGLVFPLKYSANSLAALKFPETHMDMVSIGSAFLGNRTVNPAVPLTKVYRCRVKVLQVRNLAKGSVIGYSNTYQAKHDTRVAVLPIGYTDGFAVQKRIDAFRFIDFLREQYNLVKTFLRPGYSVFFEGKPLKIVGKTSLQLTVVEIGDLPVKPGDIVEVDLNPLLANARMTREYVGYAIPGLRVDSGLPVEAVFAAEREAAAAKTETAEDKLSQVVDIQAGN